MPSRTPREHRLPAQPAPTAYCHSEPHSLPAWDEAGQESTNSSPSPRTQQNAGSTTQQNAERSRTQDPRTQQNAGRLNAERRICVLGWNADRKTQQNAGGDRTQQNAAVFWQNADERRTQQNTACSGVFWFSCSVESCVLLCSCSAVFVFCWVLTT